MEERKEEGKTDEGINERGREGKLKLREPRKERRTEGKMVKEEKKEGKQLTA